MFLAVGASAVIGGCGASEESSTQEQTSVHAVIAPPESGCVSKMNNHHMYWFCGALQTWNGARAKCQSIGFDLVRLDGPSENEFVRINRFGAPWVGANDIQTEGKWRWTIDGDQFWAGRGNGSAVGGLYANWELFQPDDAFGQDCARMNFLSGKWEDQNCGTLNPYVCESTNDLCPADPDKIEPGECGCGVPDRDTDLDGVLNCRDGCPNDPARLAPGDCGCADAPRAAGTLCDDGLCDANRACNGAGACGEPADCTAPDLICSAATFAGSHYWICNIDRPFNDARQRCQSSGMDLAVIGAKAEDDFLTSRILEHSFIGATDSAVEGEFVWLPSGAKFWTGGPLGSAVAGAYTNWDVLQPAELLLGAADCVVKDPILFGGKWETRSCDIGDAFICEKAIPTGIGQGFDPDPFLDPIAQSSNDSAGIEPNPNYGDEHPDGSPRHDFCGPGLEIESTLQGVEVQKSFAFTTGNSTPGDPDCHVAYRQCDEDETVITVSEADLNQPPGRTDTCEAVPPPDVCGIDESTIDRSSICQRDEDCIPLGMVCALVCAESSCTTQARHCARPSASCFGLPEESPCSTVRECAEPDSVGHGNPGDHQMTDQPATNVAESPAPDESTVPPESGVPPAYVIGDACSLTVEGAGAAQIPAQVEARDANAGNDKWGVYVHPEVIFEARANPQPIQGEAAHSVLGKAQLKAGAYVWGVHLPIVNIVASAQLKQCEGSWTRTVEVLGEPVAVGGAADDSVAPQDCESIAADRGGAGDEMKKSLLDLLTVRDYFVRAGATKELCDFTDLHFDSSVNTVVPPELDFDANCDTAAGQQAAVNHWIVRYEHALTEFRQQQQTLAADKATIANGIPKVALPLLNFERNFTVFAQEVHYPIGPVVVTIDIEVGGSWGLFGELTFEQRLNPNAVVDARAWIRPAAKAVAMAYVGVGFGLVSIGISGDLLLVGLEIPLQAGARLSQTVAQDTRPINLLGVPATGVPLAFDKTQHQWQASWTHGAHAVLTELSGEINLEARVKLLFFTERFRKRLARWDGFKQEFEFVGGDDPFAGQPNLGTFEEELVFIDPSWIRSHMGFPPTNPPPAPLPPGLGFCFNIPPPT